MDVKGRIISIIKWSITGLLAVMALFGLLFGVAQTEPGKRHMARWLSAYFSRGPEHQVEFGRLEGLIPLKIHLDRVVFRDGQGKWMELGDVALKWSPPQLFRGRLHIRELSASIIQLNRLPRPQKGAPKRRRERPAWPPEIPPLFVKRLSVESIILGESLLGKQAIFTVSGHMGVEDLGRDITAFLDIKRKDGPKGLLRVSWSLTGEMPMLAINVHAEEMEGGLLSTALGLKGAGSVLMELKGDAPLKAWKGELSTMLERYGSLESTIEWNISKKEIRLAAGGDIRLDPSLFRAQFEPLFKSGKGRFRLDASYGGRRELLVHGAHLETDAASLKLGGRVNLQSGSGSCEFALVVQDLSSLDPLIATRVQGRMALQGKLSGTFRQPQLVLSLALHEPRMAEFHASSLKCDLQFDPIGPLVSSFPGLVIRGRGRIKSPTYKDRYIPLTEGQLDWSLSAKMPAKERIDIENFELSGAEFTMAFSGQTVPSVPSFKGEVGINIKDLKRISSLLGHELSGASTLKAVLEANGQSRSLSARIEGKIADLLPPSPAIAALTGKEISYSGRVELAEANHLKIPELQLYSAAAKLNVEAFINILSGDLRCRGQMDVPQLAILSGSLGREIGGRLHLDMEISGSLQKPLVQLAATGQRILVDGIALQEAAFTLSAQNLPDRPEGRFELTLRQREHILRAESNFSLLKRNLYLPALSITGPGTEARGNFTLDLSSFTGQGSLQGKSDDLSGISSLWGEQVGGRVRFEADLLSRGKKQAMKLNLQGQALESRFGQVNALSLRSQFNDIFGAPEGTTEMEVVSFKKGNLEVERLSITAKGRTEKASFSASATGIFRNKFEFTTRGVLEVGPRGERLQFDALHGRFADYSVALTQPTVIARVSDEYILEDTLFDLGSGHFKASGKMGPREVALDARLEGLPLGFILLIGGPALSGSMNAMVHVTGPTDRPEASIELQMNGIRLEDSPIQNLPAGDLIVNAQLKQGISLATLQLEGLQEKPIKASLRVPVRFNLSPARFSLKPEGELRGHLSAELRLELIPRLFLLEEQSFKGILFTEITLTGDPNDPRIAGTLRISDGSYENGLTGTILRDVQIISTLGRGRLTLEEARATDGEKGLISLQGWVQLFPIGEFPLHLDLVVKKGDLIRRDDLSATIDGRLTLSGSLTKSKLSGDFTIGPAEFRIPDRLPPEVPDLEVVEINGPEQKSASTDNARLLTAAELGLDLTAESEGRVFVRGRGLDSEWKGKLHVTGTGRDPVITGTLSVVRGRFNFAGKPFSLTEGTLTFDGATPPSPQIDLSAEHKRSDLIVKLRLVGGLTSLQVSMDSEPSLPSDEILARLLFGRSVAQITPLQAVKLAEAANTLAGGGNALGFMDHIRRTLGVDQLDVKQTGDKIEEASVSVGKYFSDKIYVEIEKGVGTEGDKISSELELTPNISLESETGTDAHVGFGINWRWDY